ncbi:hypothetical protein [Sphingomonas sp.]|uniref:hypothetical protein n=1 Tax=Sphingomonas sp. TaxID=28214 RepID=UPI0025D1A6ED|nr:hypothetical protein [Sphingomonas sp.]
MKKAPFIIAMIVVIVAFGLMAKSIFGGDASGKLCRIADYSCNLDNYLADIHKRPPIFTNANSVAILNDVSIRKNIQGVMSKDDYEATSMLRVVLSYPQQVQMDIYNSTQIMEDFRLRGREISSLYQRKEFERLLSEISCNT